MALHIVTSRCFLTCEKITFIKLEEFPEVEEITKQPLRKKKKPGRPKKVAKSKVEPKIDYRIVIGYYPILSSGTYASGREPNECTLELSLFDKQKITALYAEIVKEVQEQHPNEAYLDRLVDKMLSLDEFKIKDQQDNVKT